MDRRAPIIDGVKIWCAPGAGGLDVDGGVQRHAGRLAVGGHRVSERLVEPPGRFVEAGSDLIDTYEPVHQNQDWQDSNNGGKNS